MHTVVGLSIPGSGLLGHVASPACNMGRKKSAGCVAGAL